MKVEFEVLKRQFEKYQSEFEEASIRVLRSGYYVLGPEVKKFEQQFADYCGCKYCVSVGNGLDALRFAVTALGIKEGDEVIVQANTFIATPLAVSEAGATPVFVDCDSFFGIDANKIEAAISEKTKAIMVVHLYGQPCDIDSILAIAKKHNLFVIEDCAQAHGATYKGQKIGSFGDVACFSFYPTKPVGAFGDAGAVVTNSQAVAEKVQMLRNYGSRVKYHHDILGVNSRLDEMQAALLQVSLAHADEGNVERNEIADIYLKGINNPKVVLPSLREGATHAFHIFAIRCDNRDNLMNYLEENGIHTLTHYPVPCHLAKCYESLGYKSGDFPMTERNASTEISLPIYVGMPKEEVRNVVEVINKF